ncbi:hypothetical protein D3C87_2061100 [compost metagenome]
MNTEISSNWPNRKAEPEAIAMRGVAAKKERTIATRKPTTTTRRAMRGPKWRLVRSVTRNAKG